MIARSNLNDFSSLIPGLLVAAGIAMTAAPAPVVAEQLLRASDALALSAENMRAADPSVDTRRGSVAVVWTARGDGRTVLLGAQLRARQRAIDDPPFVFDTRGNVSDPVVRFDADRNAVAVWVETEELRSRLVTQRLGGGLREVIASSDVLMAGPSLAFDADNLPVVAWFEGGANRYAVLAASTDAGVGWVSEPLTSGLDAYDILPTVIGGEQPTVYWYSLTDHDDGTEVRAARREPGATTWIPEDPGLLAAIPANRLPYLYDTHTDLGPGAIWVETVTGGEFVVSADPRRPLEIYAQPAPRGEALRQLDPDATGNHARTAAYAWREEGGPSGREIIVAAQDDVFRLAGDSHASQPRLAADSSGALHLVYVSDQLSGGTGSVYWLPISRGTAQLRPISVSIFDFDPADPVF